MAITQDSLTEEILSRQERAVVRGIYRASRLAEALVTLDKIVPTIQSCGAAKSGNSSAMNDEHIISLRDYIAQQVRNALVNTKVPASVNVVKEISPSKT